MTFIGFTLGHGLAYVGNKWGLFIQESDVTLLLVLDYYIRTIPIWFLVCLVVFSLLAKKYLDQEIEQMEMLNQQLSPRFNSKNSDFEKQTETLDSFESAS